MVNTEVLEQHESRDRNVAISRKYNVAVIEGQEPVGKWLKTKVVR